MNYVKQSNNTVVSIHEIRREHPNVSIPADADLSLLGYTKLVSTQAPPPLPWHHVEEGAPTNSTQTWAQVPMSDEWVMAACEEVVQHRLDAFAKTRNYDGILSACTYATSAVPKFAAEGQHCVALRDATWAKCYEILNAVQGGTRPMPTLDELLAELPALEWPA